MYRLLLVLLFFAACKSTPKNEFAFTKWQLYSMSSDSTLSPDFIDSMMINAFNTDTTYRVYADFNTDTTVAVIINNSSSKDTTATNYQKTGDTLYLNHTDTKDIDTFLIKSLSKEMFHVTTLNGVVFKFKRLE